MHAAFNPCYGNEVSSATLDFPVFRVSTCFSMVFRSVGVYIYVYTFGSVFGFVGDGFGSSVRFQTCDQSGSVTYVSLRMCTYGS